MTAVKKVAIAGSGVAALATAIQLAKAGVEVDIFEAKPALSALGSGITLQGNALRVFDALGAWDDIRDAGYVFQGFTCARPGRCPGRGAVAGRPVRRAGIPRSDGDAAPRPRPHPLRARREGGRRSRFGAKVTGITETDAGVEVFVNDESAGVYDLLVGADGLNSKVRDLIGIETKPQPTGMGIWRSFVSRPAEVERSELYYGGPVFIAGYTPTGENSMYAFLVEKAEDRFGISDEDARASCSMSPARTTARGTRSAPTSKRGRPRTTRGSRSTSSRAVEPRSGHHHRRCRPQLPSDDRPGCRAGAGRCVGSDRAVGEPGRGRSDAVGRVPRPSTAPRNAVVEASVQLGQWQLEGIRDADVPGLMFGIAHKMAVPA